MIFDMDGLLLDTESLAQRSWQQAAGDCGFELDDSLFLRLIGRTRRDSAEILASAVGDGFRLDEFRTRCRVRWEEVIAIDGIPLKPGVVELLDHLEAVGIGSAVATSTGFASAERALEIAGVRERFPLLVTGDQVENGKPAQDIFLKASELVAVAPAQCLVLEDSPYGIMAAHAAGAIPVMVPDLVAPTPEIERLAWRIVPSLHEVLELIRD
ncbi:MAG TPA: HAD family phosphatase [Blastocatellia bacterium]|nr:HAD family phosphatase [Blastocatellia bacterium]